MPRICKNCGKGPLSGNKVSHANNKSRTVQRPNLQRVMVKLPSGERRRQMICTQCISGGKIQKG